MIKNVSEIVQAAAVTQVRADELNEIAPDGLYVAFSSIGDGSGSAGSTESFQICRHGEDGEEATILHAAVTYDEARRILLS
ncbi:hypothetical protein [Tomitella biformata]|uniref:hypothetical protein n=1 Tax=Tomitella biformata TaxID=630403 RepID=UPI000467E5F3|nr:hypothetical protein [Tomitella biformata]